MAALGKKGDVCYVLRPKLSSHEFVVRMQKSHCGTFAFDAGRSSYAASKAAMIGYFDSLRAEVAAHGIGVTVVVPGVLPCTKAVPCP